jgi:hypothetical protein
MIFALRLPQWRKRSWLWSGLALSGLGYGLFIWQAWTNLLPGVLTTFPLFSLALAFVDRTDDPSPTRPVYQLVFITTLTFFGAMLVVWPAFGGEQWGARYLLLVYPLLLLLAFYVVTVWERPLSNAVTITAAGLLLLSLLLQMSGLHLLFIKHQEQIKDKAIVASLPAALILTNNPFLPSYMTALDDKLFMYVEDEQDVVKLISRMKQNQIDRFALVLATGRPISVPDHVENISIQEIQPFVYQLK